MQKMRGNAGDSHSPPSETVSSQEPEKKPASGAELRVSGGSQRSWEQGEERVALRRGEDFRGPGGERPPSGALQAQDKAPCGPLAI